MFYVYIMTNKTNTVIYTGITNNLISRINQHKSKQIESFTKRYNIHKLVYYEEFTDSFSAISREKQIKAGSRHKKLNLITNMNPDWLDLYKLIVEEKDMNEFIERRDEYLLKRSLRGV